MHADHESGRHRSGSFWRWWLRAVSLVAWTMTCVVVARPAAAQVFVGLDAFHLSYLQSVSTTIETTEGPVRVEAQPGGVSGLAPVLVLRRQKWQLAGRAMFATADVVVRGGGNRVSDDRDDRSVVETQLEVSRAVATVTPGSTLRLLVAPSVAWWAPQEGQSLAVLGADAGAALDFGVRGRLGGVLRATVGVQGGTLSAAENLGSGDPGRPTQFRIGIAIGLRFRS